VRPTSARMTLSLEMYSLLDWSAVLANRRAIIARSRFCGPGKSAAQRAPLSFATARDRKCTSPPPAYRRSVPANSHSGAAIDIFRWQIDEVLLAEAALRFRPRSHRLWQRHRNVSLLACQNLGAVEVATIGNDVEVVSMKNLFRPQRHVGKL